MIFLKEKMMMMMITLNWVVFNCSVLSMMMMKWKENYDCFVFAFDYCFVFAFNSYIICSQVIQSSSSSICCLNSYSELYFFRFNCYFEAFFPLLCFQQQQLNNSTIMTKINQSFFIINRSIDRSIVLFYVKKWNIFISNQM